MQKIRNTSNLRTYLTHCGQMTLFGDIDLGQHWLRQWLSTWRHQAITWTKANFSLVRCYGIHMTKISQWEPRQLLIYFIILWVWKLSFQNYCHISEEPKCWFDSYPEDTYSVHAYEREKQPIDHLYHSVIWRLTILQTNADSSLTAWAHSTDGSKSLAHNGLSRTLLQAITQTNADLLSIRPPKRDVKPGI